MKMTMHIDEDVLDRVMKIPDLIIAATALEADATVLTFDARFKKIPGLRAIDRLP